MAQPEVQYHNSPGIAELNGRAGFCLAAVSSGLIALAFIGQLSQLGTAFYVFGLVLLPTLAFGPTGSASTTSTPRRRSPGT